MSHPVFGAGEFIEYGLPLANYTRSLFGPGSRIDLSVGIPGNSQLHEDVTRDAQTRPITIKGPLTSNRHGCLPLRYRISAEVDGLSLTGALCRDCRPGISSCRATLGHR